MIISQQAIIAEEKIRDYLLIEKPKGDKSRYLKLAGYTRKEYWELLRDIREQLNHISVKKHMRVELFKEAVLNRDIEEDHLKKGDLVTVIDYLEQPEPGYMLEIFDALGNTVDVVSVPEAYIEPLHEGERLQVRHIEV